MPELSYGSHMFQDLVESDIFYAAIFENEHTLSFHPECLERFPNLFGQICPLYAQLDEMIRVYQPDNCTLYHDFQKEITLCTV